MNDIIEFFGSEKGTVVIGISVILTTALAAWALARHNYKQYIVN